MGCQAKFKRVICSRCVELYDIDVAQSASCYVVFLPPGSYGPLLLLGYRFVSIDLWEPVRFRGEAVQDERIPRRDPLYINFT